MRATSVWSILKQVLKTCRSGYQAITPADFIPTAPPEPYEAPSAPSAGAGLPNLTHQPVFPFIMSLQLSFPSCSAPPNHPPWPNKPLHDFVTLITRSHDLHPYSLPMPITGRLSRKMRVAQACNFVVPLHPHCRDWRLLLHH
jgi:hypothetical protein